MANADIHVLGVGELPLIVELYNDIFRPPRDLSFFERRLNGRSPLILLAHVEKRPVAFAIGYEIKPSTFYCWFIGTLSDYRRQGIASQLMEAMAAWVGDNGYETIRFECYNQQRPMRHLAITQTFNIVGIRYDRDAGDNLIIMEREVEPEVK